MRIVKYKYLTAMLVSGACMSGLGCGTHMQPLTFDAAVLSSATGSGPINSSSGNAVTVSGNLEVYAGCALPTFDAWAQTFYLDPINGKATNDGLSATTALPSLEVVLSSGLIDWLGWQATKRTSSTWYGYPDLVNGEKLITTHPNAKTAKIPLGSHLLLMSGDHGNPAVSGAILDKWIDIKPAPNASPILHSLSLTGTSHWLVHGLTFTSTKPGGWMFFAGSNSFYGPANNLIFDGNTLSTPGLDPHSTAAATIKATVGQGIWMRDMECPTITRNKITMVETGISIYSGSLNEAAMDASTTKGERYVLVKDNEINYVAGQDGIDWAGDHMLIDGNYVHNFIETQTGLHYDGMQGQAGSGQETQTETDITFQNNRVIRQDDPLIAAPAYMQGIDAFDGTYDQITVRNNFVVTGTYHGIAFYGASHLTIDHNTVLNDGSSADGQPNRTWIGAFTGKDGYVPSNVTITNNIAYEIEGLPAAAGGQPVGGVISGNIVSHTVPVLINGSWVTESKAGAYANDNSVDQNLLSYFANWNFATMAFDAEPMANSPAAGKGYRQP